MSNFKLFMIIASAFTVGDAEGVFRANRRAKKIIAQKDEKLAIAQMKIDALVEFVKTAADDPEGATERFMEKREFIDIVEKL